MLTEEIQPLPASNDHHNQGESCQVSIEAGAVGRGALKRQSGAVAENLDNHSQSFQEASSQIYKREMAARVRVRGRGEPYDDLISILKLRGAE